MFKKNLDNQYKKWQKNIDKRHFHYNEREYSYEEKVIYEDRIKYCQEFLEVAISDSRKMKGGENKSKIQELNLLLEKLDLFKAELNVKLEHYHGCISKCYYTSFNDFYGSFDEDSSEPDSDTDDDEQQGLNFKNYNVSVKFIEF